MPEKEKRTISLVQIALLKYKRAKLLKKRREMKQRQYDKHVLKISENEIDKKEARKVASEKLGLPPKPPKGWRYLKSNF